MLFLLRFSTILGGSKLFWMWVVGARASLVWSAWCRGTVHFTHFERREELLWERIFILCKVISGYVTCWERVLGQESCHHIATPTLNRVPKHIHRLCKYGDVTFQVVCKCCHSDNCIRLRHEQRSCSGRWIREWALCCVDEKEDCKLPSLAYREQTACFFPPVACCCSSSLVWASSLTLSFLYTLILCHVFMAHVSYACKKKPLWKRNPSYWCCVKTGGCAIHFLQVSWLAVEFFFSSSDVKLMSN